MSDARSLLRAKKASSAPQIQHQYATYNSAGSLRCIICSISVQHWDAHLSSKQHRTSVTREKELERKNALKKRSTTEDAEAERTDTNGAKRQKVEKDEATAAVDDESEDDDENSTNTLPAGFFSSSTTVTAAPAPAQEPTAAAIDDELDSFLSSLASIPAASAPTSNATETFARATYEAAPVLLDANSEGAEKEKEVVEDEDMIRKRKELEEKEEIMSRLEEEERAQEDAYDRVDNLKARLELIKKRRAETKLKKAASASA